MWHRIYEFHTPINPSIDVCIVQVQWQNKHRIWRMEINPGNFGNKSGTSANSKNNNWEWTWPTFFQFDVRANTWNTTYISSMGVAETSVNKDSSLSARCPLFISNVKKDPFIVSLKVLITAGHGSTVFCTSSWFEIYCWDLHS